MNFIIHIKKVVINFNNLNNMEKEILREEYVCQILDKIAKEKDANWFKLNAYLMFDKDVTSEELLKYGIKAKQVFPNFSNMEEFDNFLYDDECLDDMNEIFGWGVDKDGEFTDEHLNQLKFFRVYQYIVSEYNSHIVMFDDFNGFKQYFESFIKKDFDVYSDERHFFFFKKIRQYCIFYYQGGFLLVRRNVKTFKKECIFLINLNEDDSVKTEKFNKLIDFVKTGLFRIIN